jgi:hypothetical protein
MELGKQLETFFCFEPIIEENMDNFRNLEQIGLSFFNKPLNEFKNINEIYQNLNINFNELKDYVVKLNTNFKENLKSVNQVLRDIINYANDKKNNISVNKDKFLFYVCYLAQRILFLVIYSDYFNYQNNEIKDFLSLYHKLKKIVLQKDSTCTIKSISCSIEDFQIINLFSDISKENFLEVLGILHTFLSIILTAYSPDPTDPDYEEFEGFDREYMEDFIQIFNLFWKINQKLNLVNFKEFYNDTLSSSYDINEELRIYYYSNFKKRKPSSPDIVLETKFSLCNFLFLFSSSRKSDILKAINQTVQRKEMVNTLSSMLLSNQINNLHEIGLVLEIKRTDMIKDTLDQVVKSDINLRKQLRVFF